MLFSLLPLRKEGIHSHIEHYSIIVNINRMSPRKKMKIDEAEPEFVTYLLDPSVSHDTYFRVGKKQTKIGAVKKMLVAHSAVLRSELQDSELAEKGDIYLTDISPETFKNLLKYVYGYNNISTLSFDEADDLLYAADKYLMDNLKDQLALRLIDLLNFQNICSLLNNPVCHTVQALDDKIMEILQYETNDVFLNPDFVNVRVEEFVKILELNALCTTEMEIWKTALKWAKHQAKSEVGSVLRKYISQLKYIRIHTFGHEEFRKEIIPTNVLTDEEVVKFSFAYEKCEQPPLIEGFSHETPGRAQLKQEYFRSYSIYARKNFIKSSMTIKPTHDIILLPMEFIAKDDLSPTSVELHQCDCTIEVTRVSDPPDEVLYPKIISKFNEKIKLGQTFKVPLNTRCKKLLSNNTYKITIAFNEARSLDLSHDVLSLVLEEFNSIITIDNSYRYTYDLCSLKYIKCLTN